MARLPRGALMAQGERRSCTRPCAGSNWGGGCQRLAPSSFSPCGRRWREAPDEGLSPRRQTPHPSRRRCASAIHLLPQGEKEKGTPPLFAELLRGPCIKAAGNRLLAAAAFWRDVQADDAGIGEQAGKVCRLEEQFRLGMHRIEGLLRQRVLQFTRAAGERGYRGRAVDGDADVGETARSVS